MDDGAAALMLRRATRIAAAAVVLLSGCGPRGADEGPLLHQGARVRFQTARAEGRWTTAEVGGLGPCLALMVPDSWSEPRRFDVVMIDSVTALRRSTKYDGLPGADGTPRTARTPPDTTGEEWLDLPMDRVRRQHGGCDPMR